MFRFMIKYLCTSSSFYWNFCADITFRTFHSYQLMPHWCRFQLKHSKTLYSPWISFTNASSPTPFLRGLCQKVKTLVSTHNFVIIKILSHCEKKGHFQNFTWTLQTLPTRMYTCMWWTFNISLQLFTDARCVSKFVSSIQFKLSQMHIFHRQSIYALTQPI